MMLSFFIALLATVVPVPADSYQRPLEATDSGLIDSDQVRREAHFQRADQANQWVAPSPRVHLGLADPVLQQVDPATGETHIGTDVGEPIFWSADQVGSWAADHSPRAAMIETERNAIACGLNRRDARQCAQVGLIQATLAHVARHERNRSAADALETYFRAAGLQQQREQLLAAAITLDALVSQANRAAEVGLPGADPDQLLQQRLELQDQITQVKFGAQKLRLSLAWITGQQETESLAAELSDQPLGETGIGGGSDPIAIAMAHRHDLKAAETLCRCMSADSLPAAKSMLGVLQPGIGLASAAVSPAALLGMICRKGKAGSDLGCRRQQCRQLQTSIREQIRSEVLIAQIDLQEASERLKLASDRSQLAQLQLQRTEASIAIDEANVGADRLAKLRLLERQGEMTSRWIDHAVAEVRLREAQGIVVP